MAMTLAELDLPPDADAVLASLGEQKEALDGAAREYAREVQAQARVLLGSVGRLEEACKLLYTEALAGKAAEAHALRDRLLGAFERRVALLNKAHGLALHAGKVAGGELPEAGLLVAEAEALAGKLARLAARWRTAEDLEDLAAEAVEVSAEKVEAIREKYGFPRAWYEGTGEPF